MIHRSKSIIKLDVDRWINNKTKQPSYLKSVLILLITRKEFRNLFYYRLGKIGRFLNFFLPKCSSLFILTPAIGSGCFIQHGFATIISAKSIGKNAWINQQVTIGYSNNVERPVLLDNVTVNAGAKVIGGITIGNNVIIGANAVVIKDVPDNCTVVGVPAYIVRKNGIKIKESL